MAYTGKLDRDGIVREAIVLLNEGGIEAVSLRRIAERLGARAPSLARHVGDKGQLLHLLSTTIFLSALDLIPEGLHGNAWLEAFGRALRTKQAETRDVLALISLTPPEGGHQGERVAERLDQMMRAAGLTYARASLERDAIQALVTGWMTFEKGHRNGGGSASGVAAANAFGESLRALIAGFAASRS